MIGGVQADERSDDGALTSSDSGMNPGMKPDLDLDAVSARLQVALGRLLRTLRRAGVAEIGPGALGALATLHRHGPMRLGDLAAREGVAPPTLTRIVVALEEAGYVRRQVDPMDRRAVVVSITDSGEGTVKGIGSARAALLRSRLGAVPDGDLALLVAALPVLESLATEDL
jgi:DNA-binding MarR family transcriptional regulator